jgi:uncharacterized protein
LRSLIPHTLPYLAYVAIGAAAGGVCPWADAVRVVAVVAALVAFARAGSYPELRTRPSAAQVLLGVAAGLVAGAAWVPLAKLVPPLMEGGRTGLDPAASLLLTTLRIASMVLVVPFAEELFVRSALPRLVDAAGDEDWRGRAVGAFTARSFAVSVLFFALTHCEWLAALATGVLWTALLAKTRNLRVVIVAHAVANSWLAAHVVVTGETQWW